MAKALSGPVRKGGAPSAGSGWQGQWPPAVPPSGRLVEGAREARFGGAATDERAAPCRRRAAPLGPFRSGQGAAGDDLLCRLIPNVRARSIDHRALAGVEGGGCLARRLVLPRTPPHARAHTPAASSARSAAGTAPLLRPARRHACARRMCICVGACAGRPPRRRGPRRPPGHAAAQPPPCCAAAVVSSLRPASRRRPLAPAEPACAHACFACGRGVARACMGCGSWRSRERGEGREEPARARARVERAAAACLLCRSSCSLSTH
jgi:hypothetical protein